MLRRLPARTNPNASPPPGNFGLTPQQVEAWLLAIEARHLPPEAGPGERQQFRRQLHLDDLLLARACSLGCAAAWEQLWTTYQPRLRSAALALARDAETARELADNLLGDLFGLRASGQAADSKLLAYHGLGSLEAWLCTLLAQSHINHWRQHRRQVPLDAGLETAAPLRALLVAPNQESVAVAAECRPLAAAITAALQAVAPETRLLLNLYYVDGHTLNEIAQLLQVHESTVSRRLARQLQRLRREVRRQLGRQGLRPAASEAVLRSAAQMEPGWLHLDLRAALRAPHTPSNAHGA